MHALTREKPPGGEWYAVHRETVYRKYRMLKDRTCSVAGTAAALKGYGSRSRSNSSTSERRIGTSLLTVSHTNSSSSKS